MGYQICKCGKPVVKSTLRGNLVAFYDSNGNQITHCVHCGDELKETKEE